MDQSNNLNEMMIRLDERVKNIEKNSATKEDIANMRTELESRFSDVTQSISDLSHKIDKSAERSENKFLKVLIGSVFVLVGIVAPLISKTIDKVWP